MHNGSEDVQMTSIFGSIHPRYSETRWRILASAYSCAFILAQEEQILSSTVETLRIMKRI